MASLNYPYTFTNGTTADANQVMSDLNAVKTFVESSVVQADGSVQAPTAAIANSAVTTAKIADANVTADKIASAVAGNGLAGGAGAALSVNVDSSTIEINSDSLRVKDAGIVAAKLASNSVETAKIADAAVTNAKLAGATGTWTPTRSSGTFSYAEGSYYMVGQIMYFYLFGNLSSNITTTLNILLPSGTYDSGTFGITGHYNYGSVYLYVIGTCGSSGTIGVNLLDGTSGMLTDIYNHPINSPQRGNGDQIILRGWVRKTA